MSHHKRDIKDSTDDTESQDVNVKIEANAGDDNGTGSGTGSDEEFVGPEPVVKKKKVLPFEKIFKSNLPCAEAYERSYMHRDVVKFALVAHNTHYIVTGSVDGHIKFWIKKAIGIEFVKHIRAHLGTIEDMSINNPLGTLLASISEDKSLKIFDIVNFDLINMFHFDYKPGCVEWCYSTISTNKDPFPVVAVSDTESNKIYTYDALGGTKEPLHVLEKIHSKPVIRMRFNSTYAVMVSVDRAGMLDYWSTHRNEYKFPSSIVQFTSKLETNLYDLAKIKHIPHDIAFTCDGNHMAMICSDRKIRVYRFLTGKLLRIYDESLTQLTQDQQEQQLLPNMEFGRRIAAERDLEKTDMFRTEKIAFDDSGNFLIYPSLLGIKIIGWKTNSLVKLIGKGENFRPLSLSLIQAAADIKHVKSIKTAEMVTAANPTLENAPQVDPTLFVTGFRKNRFYMFTRREPDDSSLNASADGILTGLERDVFNEKPSREEMIAASTAEAAAAQKRLGDSAVIHTTKGDITVKLFPKDTPKTVENFATHSRNGYYNGHIFHRVIRQFMIQTGDPTGTGTGGESIWGGEFEDEFVPHLKCDKPFMLCMANAGPNTNGSQFFITVVPTPWLNDKHTVFGQVTKGMDVVQAISKVRTQKSTDKPFDDIKILNINVK